MGNVVRFRQRAGLGGLGENTPQTLWPHFYAYAATQTAWSQLTPAQQLALLQPVLNNPVQTQAPAGVPPDVWAAYLRSQAGGGGVGFGIDEKGLRLSDGTHITWGTMAIVGVAIVLLQSKGFQRRER
jgi:hypothetical protein